MQFKRLLLLLFSIHIGFPLSLNSVDLLKFCAMMCFHLPVFSGNCNRDYVLLQSESIWGFGFSILTGEDSHIFCFHIFFYSIFLHFSISHFQVFFLLFIIPLCHSCNSAHSWKKKKRQLSLKYRLYLEGTCFFLCFYGLFFLLQFLSF